MPNVKAKDLKAGDNTPWYKILKVSRDRNQVVIEVQYQDGGLGRRVFENPDKLVLLCE